jgi:hypothetical protein
MKTLTKEESLKALQFAIEKEAQQKGKKALYDIAKRNETFKIVSFEEKEDEIGNTTRKWINFNYISKLAGEDTTLSASMILFRKNLYKDNNKDIEFLILDQKINSSGMAYEDIIKSFNYNNDKTNKILEELEIWNQKNQE